MVDRFRRKHVLYIVTVEPQAVNVAYFQIKIQLSGFSAYPVGSRSQLIRISGVQMYLNFTDRKVEFVCAYSGYSEKLFQTVFIAPLARYKSINYRFPCRVSNNSCFLSLPVVW